MGEPVEDGAAASSSSFSSRSSSSGADEGALQEPLRGYGARAPPVAGVVKPIPRRLWAAVRARAPRLRYACENAAGEFVAWTRQGGAPRALLVVSVGSVALPALTGLLIVVVFVAAAATNAVVFSVLVSMTAAGGFLAVLLALLAAAYACALSAAVFVISATTIATIIAVTIATGWAAFFWVLWFAARECLNLTTKRWTTGATIP
ncbi:hypothetical protein SETIT_2G197000v2 [Setaria italica]|uniref:Uncharacterized protein n=1 Tax=Setaria italica TaxID=4555 RepID=K3ZWZ5_SETIT|nr:uncharacterized protein LOC101755497 [Setaria italica]RCV11576.1 hypothetical protein SETIT_2G197000v2 [Setaria italica]